ncbi:GerAB/ArcD/ProY family transporter [Geobacillus thermodenitrificans]|uniref:GerAB/ArcD/ProY family transporter n=1 Tax=Geobacillus thermodenitrificans TaxID=33940 RepID=UPI002E23310C|nr:GerAB/ArcD/ProY family transporter [Geobacillus thermodenitrificans]MED3718208.1 GerAB/ArcD/ProY family transporter [Geobacillus thermodenitrificans]MED4918084.1 GerAB/ArcD/ProY family transporter [Geobacillus thermodenitrificans]
MESSKINVRQLFVLIVLFEHGSAVVIPLGVSAKQDVWISILLSLAIGLLLFFVYRRLFEYYPDQPLTAYLPQIVGAPLGKLLAIVYITYFLYIAARVLRDFGELLLTFAYPETPLFVLNAIMAVTVMYGVYKGIEVLARTGELFLIVLYFLAIIGFVLVFVSGIVDVTQLQPMLEEGWRRVWKTVFTETLYIPFGEMIVFTMLFPYINTPTKVGRAGVVGMVLSGINLALIMAINVAVLGPDTVSRSSFPLLDTIRRVQVADFLERLDVFFMITLITGGFFKISIFFYAGIVGAANLFGISSYRRLVYPLGLLILILSVVIASNYAEHIQEGLKIVTFYLHVPLQVIIPVLLLIIAAIRRRFNQPAK